MAAPRSLEEMNSMADLVRQRHKNYRAWIACNDIEVEGNWQCDGQEGREPFLRWASGRPNNLRGDQDCGTMVSKFNYNMDDIACGSSHEAFCVRQAACFPRSIARPGRFCLSTDTHGRILSSTCLLDHVIREFVTDRVTVCGATCIVEPGCRSFNIKENEEGMKICQLNNSTRSEDKDKFQNSTFLCIYMEVCIG